MENVISDSAAVCLSEVEKNVLCRLFIHCYPRANNGCRRGGGGGGLLLTFLLKGAYATKDDETDIFFS